MAVGPRLDARCAVRCARPASMWWFRDLGSRIGDCRRGAVDVGGRRQRTTEAGLRAALRCARRSVGCAAPADGWGCRVSASIAGQAPHGAPAPGRRRRAPGLPHRARGPRGGLKRLGFRVQGFEVWGLGRHLLRRHRDVDLAKVLGQPMAHQGAPHVHQVAQLQVRLLLRGEVPARAGFRVVGSRVLGLELGFGI